MPKIKEPKKPTVTAETAEAEIGRIERRIIDAITYWVYNSPEQSIMITPGLDIYITSPNRYSLGKNAEIVQVRINEAGKIVVKDEYSDAETMIENGDYSTNDIAAIFSAVEQTIVVKD